MKSLKIWTLSVLMLSFVFITFHDYMGLSSSTHTSVESVCTSDTSANIDLKDIVHDSMHNLLIAYLEELAEPLELLPFLKTDDLETTLVSVVLQVPNPPPLS